MTDNTVQTFNINQQASQISAETLQELQLAAEQGNAEAQHQLGMIYANGNGVDLDYNEAAKWQQKAADQGHVKALRTLAWLYASGFGVQQDNNKARDICIQLAQRGDPKDQYFMATLYQTGMYDTEPDSQKMIQWYYQSAQQQYPRAQYALAKAIMSGRDISPNDEMAFQWLSLAVVNGHKKAGDELRKLTEHLPPEVVEQYKQRMMEQMKQAIN